MRRRTFLGGATALTALAALPARAARARVVSIGGGVTECVYALGGESMLVGVDSTSTWPEAARSLPVVGYQRTLSAEGVLSLMPTLVLAGAEAGPPQALARLSDAGVKVVAVPESHDVDAPLAKLNSIASSLGLTAQAARVQARYHDAWRATRARLERLRDKPRVLFILAHGGSPMVAGQETAADAMLELAGCANAVRFPRYRPMSAEGVIMAQPEAILVTSEGLAALGGAEALWKLPGLVRTPAGHARRLASMDALLLLGFGPRLPLAVSELADKLHRG